MTKKIINNLHLRPRATYSSVLTAATNTDRARWLRAAGRWIKPLWLLAAVVLIGLTRFRDAITDSIASTPHPMLVYVIFVVAAVAAGLFAMLLATLVREHDWFEQLRAAPRDEQEGLIEARDPGSALTPLYRLVSQTTELPLGQRKQALDHEVDSAEVAVMGRAALPNLLSGSLVGMGLVGTFVGLLGTLHDLSGVFSAFGGSSTGDAATMFSTMIQKLKGPIQGMGTAFVASLYGLLGSLVIGLVGLGVRRIGEDLFSDIRLYVSEEIYQGGMVAPSAVVEGESELSTSMRLLAAVTREEHGKLRESMGLWSQALDQRLEKVATITTGIGAEIQEAADYVGTSARRSVESLEKARETNERLFFGMNEVSKGLIDRLDALHQQLDHAGDRKQMRMVVAALGTALFALGIALGSVTAGRSAVSAPGVGDSAIGIAPVDVSSAAPASAPTAGRSPSAAPVSAPVSAPSPAGTAPAEIMLNPGDTLTSVAHKHGIPLDDIVAANPQIRNTDAVNAGEPIRLQRP